MDLQTATQAVSAAAGSAAIAMRTDCAADSDALARAPIATPSLAVPSAFAAGATPTDLRVDTNRDGTVDVTIEAVED